VITVVTHVLCFRYVDSGLALGCEMFTGSHELARQNAETVHDNEGHIPIRSGINIVNCGVQCYDGAANVAGSNNDLQSK